MSGLDVEGITPTAAHDAGDFTTASQTQERLRQVELKIAGHEFAPPGPYRDQAEVGPFIAQRLRS